MESVFITGLDANQTMEIVRELRAQGLVQGTDFNFKYLQGKYAYMENEETQPRGAEFYFREGKWRTYLAIKYAS